VSGGGAELVDACEVATALVDLGEQVGRHVGGHRLQRPWRG
jgi:hypothetical protein